MIESIEIAPAAWDALLQHAAAAFPHECCGLLLGGEGRVVDAHRARNVAGDPRRRFRVDPEDHFAAIRRARRDGLAVVGAYHSHPEGEPRPSETDLGEAIADEEFIHVIVGPTRPGATPRIAAYCLITGNFVGVRLVRSS